QPEFVEIRSPIIEQASIHVGPTLSTKEIFHEPLVERCIRRSHRLNAIVACSHASTEISPRPVLTDATIENPTSERRTLPINVCDLSCCRTVVRAFVRVVSRPEQPRRLLLDAVFGKLIVIRERTVMFRHGNETRKPRSRSVAALS